MQFSNPFVANADLQNLAWNAFWQLSLTILAVMIVVRLFARHRPHLAHALWLVVLAKCVLPPVMTNPLVMIPLRDWWPDSSQRPQSSSHAAAASDQIQLVESGAKKLRSLTALQSATMPAAVIDDGDAVESGMATDHAVDQPLTGSKRLKRLGGTGASDGNLLRTMAGFLGDNLGRIPWLSIWAAGSIATTLLLCIRLKVGLRRLRRTLVRPSERISKLADEIGETIGLQREVIHRRVTVRLSTEELGPAVIGFFRPVVILPWSLRDASIAELRPSLGHELMHVRRQDAIVAFVQSVAKCIWWFHPLYWLTNRRLVASREQCCDEQTVVRLNLNPAEYSQQLLNVLNGKLSRRFGKPALAMSAADVTTKRLEHLMIRHDSFLRSTPRRYWCLAILVALFVLPGAAAPQIPSDAVDADKTAAKPVPGTTGGTKQRLVDLRIEPARNHVAANPANDAVLVENQVKRRWEFELGTVTASRPVISGDRLYLQVLYPGARQSQNPAGALLCLNRSTGELLWKYESAPPAKSVTHGAIAGILPVPVVLESQLYYSTPAAQVVCIDLGKVVDGETPKATWTVDLIRRCASEPGYLAASDLTVAGDLILLSAIHHRHVDAPRPSFEMLAIDRHHGGVVWQGKARGATIDVSWSGPAVAKVGGIHQAIFPCSDGWLYAFDLAEIATGTADPIWWFNCNPEDSKWLLGNKGTKNSCVTTPVVLDNRVYVAVGQHPENGEGIGHLWCIDATLRGDLSEPFDRELMDARRSKVIEMLTAEIEKQKTEVDRLKTNVRKLTVELSQSNAKEQVDRGVVWHQSRKSLDAEFGRTVHRSVAPPAVSDGILVLADYSGLVHGFRASDGQRLWTHDTFAMIFGQPLIIGDRVLITDEDGDLATLSLKTGAVIAERSLKGNAYVSPVMHDGTLYLVAGKKLFPLGG